MEEESLLDLIEDKTTWDKYLSCKKDCIISDKDLKELEDFVKQEAYKKVAEEIRKGRFPLAHKKIISKMSTQKKRTVYVYPREETITLKLLTHLMLRKYDDIFSKNLYSFRPNSGAIKAIAGIRKTKDIDSHYVYKADISNYFNSIDTTKFLPVLKDVLKDDIRLYFFCEMLLTEDKVYCGDEIISEKKGIMAGIPLSSFFANIFLMETDKHFEEKGITYARYSDDIIVFARTEDELQRHIEYIKDVLKSKGLTVNCDKEEYTRPYEKWTFLGISYENGIIDIAPASVKKIKGKMRRKARSLIRWSDKNDIDRRKAAKAFIRIFNRKLIETSDDRDLTWSYWYFPVINTDKSLKIIDHYAQECIRYIVSGRRTKARFNVRYEDMKDLGYRSLVNEYHKFGKENQAT
ncbi:MAG: hypothetical protein K6F49_11380 [Saccharofermentans sp.]|nr:hypothetical protein [Saccharofermentans sp.]